MSNTQAPYTGQCLCGQVKISTQTLDHHVGACHCSTCRKWTGGIILSVNCGSEVQFEGEANIQCFDSSPWAERGFCKQCGTHLFYRLKANQQHIVSVALFDQLDTEALVLDHEIFVDQKPAYYAFANATDKKTGAEVFAAFS